MLQRLQCGLAYGANPSYTQTGNQFRTDAEAQKFMLVAVVIYAVVHKVHQIGHHCFCTLTFQQFYQMIIGQRHILYQNFTDNANPRLSQTFYQWQLVKILHNTLANGFIAPLAFGIGQLVDTNLTPLVMQRIG